jgi:molybdopterin-guanine dinucleotide biosynthesis protein A
MGRDKALIEIRGAPLIKHAAATLSAVFPDVIIASDRSEEYSFLHLPIVPDIRKNCGPLGGIHAALTETKADSLFVLACDMPFVSPELIRHVVANASCAAVAVPVMDGRVQPLCGLYARPVLPVIEHALDNGMYKLLHLLEEVKATLIPIAPDLSFSAPHILDNLNSVADLERALFIANQ